MTTLDDLLALLPSNDQGLIDAVHLRTITTELWNRSSAAAEVFGYAWTTAAGPPTGRITGTWSLGVGTLQISETADDGQALSFALLDHLPGTQLRIITPGGTSVLRATVTGSSVDQGTYRDVPVNATAVTGPAPGNNTKVTVALTAVLP